VIVSHQHRFIFVKTRKTAGTSLEIALSDICGPSDIITPITPEDESARQRGPQNTTWPLRGMSAKLLYLWVRKRRRPRFYNHMPAKLIRDAVGHKVWNSYLTFTVERNPWDRAVSLYFWSRERLHGAPFSSFLRDLPSRKLSNRHMYCIDNRLVVTRVLRFERLQDDVSDLWREMGFPGKPSLTYAKGNYRPGEARDYRSMYSSDEEITIVAEACRWEIDRFGYSF
jgi:hypothetical protein